MPRVSAVTCSGLGLDGELWQDATSTFLAGIIARDEIRDTGIGIVGHMEKFSVGPFREVDVERLPGGR